MQLIRYALLLLLSITAVTSMSVRPSIAETPINWPQFRGAEATGVAASEPSQLPDRWSASENVEWKTDLLGRGWSSPVVWGNQVFVTSVINRGESEEPKKGLYFGGNREEPSDDEHEWTVYCLALDSGKIKWSKIVHQATPETSIHIKNSYASETPATDGEHVYAMFGGVGVYCLDFDGNIVWSRALKPRKTRYLWGTAASPVLHKDRLYMVVDNEEESFLLALDKSTGKEVFRVARDEKSNWSTPYIWEHNEATEIVTLGTDRVRSYDLDGQLKWWLEGMSSITIATPYEHQGLLFISSGYVLDEMRPLYAIRPGAEGNISLTEDESSNEWIAWSQPQAAPYNPSTLGYRGIVYVLYDRGFMGAYRASDGEELYTKQRLPQGRAFTSSPWAYDGKVFCLNEDGDTFVVQAGEAFNLLHVNKLQSDDMGMATPAIVGDRLLIRTAARLYSIRKPTAE